MLSREKETRVDLERKASKLEMNMIDDPSSEKMEKYNSEKLEFEKMYEYITDGIIMGSISQWCEEGEKSTKYFLSLEKKNKVKSHIRKMCLNEDEEETTDPQEILEELKNFYSGLYKKKSTKTEQTCMQHLVFCRYKYSQLIRGKTKQCKGK